MSKRKAEVEIYSYGIYDGWNPKTNEIPKVVRHTTTIPTRVGIEFGYVLIIRKARGKKLSFVIEHPPFLDSTGKAAAPFVGEEFIRDNHFEFFIGDTIWEPVDDKLGEWRITCRLDGDLIADKTFTMVPETDETQE